MRTQEEILERIKARKPTDPLGFEIGDYVNRLSFDNAKPWLKAEVTEDEWKEFQDSQLAPTEKMQDYMKFAWGKANDMRGISANRSILHCLAWLWLAEEDEFLAKVELEYDTNYHYYGKPILEMVCDYFSWDWKQWDDSVRTDGYIMTV